MWSMKTNMQTTVDIDELANSNLPQTNCKSGHLVAETHLSFANQDLPVLKFPRIASPTTLGVEDWLKFVVPLGPKIVGHEKLSRRVF